VMAADPGRLRPWTMLRSARAVFVVLVLGVVLAASTVSRTGAQTVVPPTEDRDLTECVNSDPRPNCGQAPAAPGDRGGVGQLALLGILVAATALIGAVVVRSTVRTTRARRVAPK
jgi:hypothetical protein